MTASALTDPDRVRGDDPHRHLVPVPAPGFGSAAIRGEQQIDHFRAPFNECRILRFFVPVITPQLAACPSANDRASTTTAIAATLGATPRASSPCPRPPGGSSVLLLDDKWRSFRERFLPSGIAVS